MFLEYIQPTYVNMHELASMAANKAQERNAQHNEPSSNVNFKVIFIVFNITNIYKISEFSYNLLYHCIIC